MISTFFIRSTNSFDAERATIAFINAGFKVESIDINYNVNIGLPDIENYKKYPLIMHGNFCGSKTDVYVYSVSAGYGGSGPIALVNILKATKEFDFEEDDILTKQRVDEDGNIILNYAHLTLI